VFNYTKKPFSRKRFLGTSKKLYINCKAVFYKNIQYKSFEDSKETFSKVSLVGYGVKPHMKIKIIYGNI